MQNFLSSITKLSNAKSRSISAENVYGEPGRGGMADTSDIPQPEVAKIGQGWWNNTDARELGQKWKVRPAIGLAAKSVTTIMDVDGPGCIRHIWMTVDVRKCSSKRWLILRMYWDDETAPSVEVPLGDFFCYAEKHEAEVLSIPINVNSEGGLNCYLPMPFRKHARITVENLAEIEEYPTLYYSINYTLEEIGDDDAYFHASFHRSNPLPLGEDFVIADNIRGQGHFIGCYMTWQQNNSGWWGEGEIKMFMDGDDEFPTICGTGTEDYFGGAWCFRKGLYSAPFVGYVKGWDPDRKAGSRHALYRFHLPDPIYFAESLRITMQAIGWRSERRYLPLQDDISAVAYWYQREPHALLRPLPDRNYLEVI